MLHSEDELCAHLQDAWELSPPKRWVPEEAPRRRAHLERDIIASLLPTRKLTTWTSLTAAPRGAVTVQVIDAVSCASSEAEIAMAKTKTAATEFHE